MAEKVNFDADIVRQLAQLLDETDLNEIEYEGSNCRVRVVRHVRVSQVVAPVIAEPVSSVVPTPQNNVAEFTPHAVAAPESLADHPGAVKSPMVGNAYMAAEPDAAPFVREGDNVTEGQTLLIIEAMKVMNPINAPKSGKISKILVQDGSPIEFDEVLLIIE